jgi:GLPGLI family protein
MNKMLPFIFLVGLSCLAQTSTKTVKVEYVLDTNFSIKWQRFYTLQASNINALCVEKRPEIKGSLLGRSSEGENKTATMIHWEPSNKTPEFYYSDYDTMGVVFMKNVSDKLHYVKDTVSLNWVLTNEQKLINDFICDKATLNFRGRDYVAWYTKEIPIPAGPYKFSGLPGLILTIDSVDQQVSFKATSITYDGNSAVVINDLTPLNTTIYSLQDFLKRENELIEIDNKLFHAKYAPPLTPYKICDNCREPGIEIFNPN